jgi:predicted flap endonuclease-1-like 5' DNA nuclease
MKLTTIEGIGPTFAAKLGECKIKSCEGLLSHAAGKKARLKLAEDTGIDEARILKWVNHADLMRIKGIGGEYAELLEAAGVDSVPELSKRRADNLHAKMVEVNTTKKLVRQVASEKQVAGWIDQAKALPKVVTH